MKPLTGILVSTPVGVFIATLGMTLISGNLKLGQMIEVVFLYTIVGTFFGFIISFVFGVPLYLLYKYKNIQSLWLYILGGTICSLPFWLLWFYPFDSDHWQSYGHSNTMYFFSVGAFSATIFWYLVVRPLHSNKVNHDAKTTESKYK